MSEYFKNYQNIENQLSRKATNVGYLDKADIMLIAVWGGDEERHGLGTKIIQSNTDDKIITCSRLAIQCLAYPEKALRSICDIKYIGLSYGSKILRCICPKEYGALDIHTQEACQAFITIDREDNKSAINGYVQFLELCKWIRDKVVVAGPRNDSSWYIADIEMALFQLAYPPRRGKLKA